MISRRICSAWSEFFSVEERPAVHHHAVSEHVHGQRFEIFGSGEVAAFQVSVRLGRAIEHDRAPGRHSQRQVRRVSRSPHHCQCVVHQRVVHPNPADLPLDGQHILGLEPGQHLPAGRRPPRIEEFGVRCPDADTPYAGASESGPVVIREADRCHGAPPGSGWQSPETAAAAGTSAVHRHLVLTHGLQQGRLRLGRGAVEFIRQQDIGEHRPRLEIKPLFRSGIDGNASTSLGSRSLVNWTRWK